MLSKGNKKSPATYVGDLMEIIFTKIKMATSSAKGTGCPANDDKTVKPALNQDKLKANIS